MEKRLVNFSQEKERVRPLFPNPRLLYRWLHPIFLWLDILSHSHQKQIPDVFGSEFKKTKGDHNYLLLFLCCSLTLCLYIFFFISLFFSHFLYSFYPSTPFTYFYLFILIYFLFFLFQFSYCKCYPPLSLCFILFVFLPLSLSSFSISLLLYHNIWRSVYSSSESEV